MATVQIKTGKALKVVANASERIAVIRDSGGTRRTGDPSRRDRHLVRRSWPWPVGGLHHRYVWRAAA